jgi:mycofactocin system glycosyltransferase
MRFVFDSSVRRVDGGRALIGGSPLKVYRLTNAGAAVVDKIAAGNDVEPRAFVDRLLDGGVIHPRPGRSALALTDVTVVIPAFRRPIDSVVAACRGVARIIVVDDASPIAIRRPEGVELLRHERNLGPGAARNTGLALVTTPLVAFVDDDIAPPSGWLEPLLGHFNDERVAFVAPRIESTAGAIALARYERVRSPLDLGREPARVRPRSRVSYVPAAALVMRTEAVRESGGFDAAMRVGEDVDLVWRLEEAGWRGRYEPGVVVGHEPRTTMRRWLEQRFAYGRSAAPLATRHHDAISPLAVSGWSVAAWGFVAVGHPWAGAAVTAGTAGLLTRKLDGLDEPASESLRLAGLGTLFAGRQIASAITRTWWPIAAAASLVSKRARRIVAAAIIVPALADYLRDQPDLDPAAWIALRALDDAAYGAGVWVGCLREGSCEALRPDLTSWPGPSRYEARRAKRSIAGRPSIS